MDYFLKSARLGFRCWGEEDLPLAMELWGDAEVTAFVGGPFTKEAVQARLAKEIAEMRKCGLQYWPIFLLDGILDGQLGGPLENDPHVGCAGVRPYRMEERVYELGVHLRREFWGRGL